MIYKFYSLSREQVREICPSCADKMQLARIKTIKLSADDLGNLLPDDETTIKLFAGFSKSLCNKFDAESNGFFTRCAETMSGKVEDEKGFCASLEKYCTGNWPAQNVAKKHVGDSDYQEYIDKREDVSPQEGKQRYGDVKFADEKNKKYPIDTEEHIVAAWNYINKSNNAGKYSPEDLTTVKDHIVAAWKRMIDKAGPSSSVEQKNNAVAGMKSMTRQQVATKCPYCAGKMAGNEQDMPVDAGGHMQHICGKGGRAVANLSEEKRILEFGAPLGNKNAAGPHDMSGAAVDQYSPDVGKKADQVSKEANDMRAGSQGYDRQSVLLAHDRASLFQKRAAASALKVGNKSAFVHHQTQANAHEQKVRSMGGLEKSSFEQNLQVAEYANDIKGVEIFKTGTHNGDVYTEKDLDDMVTAFGVLDYRPAIKIGHTKDAPGSPAYGWVQNITRDGDKLRADFTDMHDSVIEAIRNKNYDRCSSEIYFNLKRGGKEYRRALKAVALLGSEVPAVAGLTPLHKMEFAEAGFERIGVMEQDLIIAPQAIVDTLAERVSGLVNIMKEYDMAKNTQKIAELKDRVDELNEQIVELNAHNHKIVSKGDKFQLIGPDGKMISEHNSMADAKTALKDAEQALYQDAGEAKENQIKELTQQADVLEEEIHAMEIEEDNTGAIAALSQELAESKAREEAARRETKELSQRMDRIEQERCCAEVGSKVEACKIPAFRDSLKAVYTYALNHLDAVVKVYSKDKDGKDITTDKTLVEAIDGVVSEINSQSEKLFKALAYSGQTVRADGVVDENAGQEIDKRVTEYRTKHPEVKTYDEAMTIVLKSDTELAQRYRAQSGCEQ